MKVFEMNEFDWYLAKSIEEAAEQYELDVGPIDSDEDVPRGLSVEEMATLMLTFEDGRKLSFAEHLKHELIRNPAEPRIFASLEQ